MHYLYLLLAGVVAGTINSVAGGGVFAILPVMLATGLSTKQVNGSASVSIWLGQIASLRKNSQFLPKKARLIWEIMAVCMLGSVIGTILLVVTPEVNFRHALPILNGGATILFILGPYIKSHSQHHYKHSKFVFPLFMLGCGVYGGYFGGGLGLLMLAALSLTALPTLREQNAVKLLAANTIGVINIPLLIAANLVVWRAALPAGVGTLLGGWLGAQFFSHISTRYIRWFVIAVGIATTILLYIQLY